MSDFHHIQARSIPLGVSLYVIRAPETATDWRRNLDVTRRLRHVAALGENGNLPRDAVLRGRYGKPILARRYRKTARCFFNVSHCDGWIALAQSLAGQVGVDIEPVDPGLDLALVATPHTLSEPERDWLDRVDADARTVGLLFLWTRKEALLKAVGTGIASSLARVPGLLDVVRGWRLRSFVTTEFVLSVATGPGSFGTVTLSGEGSTLPMRELTP